MHYIGIVHKDSGSAWGISFPDLPGCVSAAASLEELVDSAAEAVALHMEGLAEDHQQAPTPSTLEQVRAHEDAADALTFLPVPAPDPDHCIRLNVTLPETLVQRIDAKVGLRQRSNFLAKAARRALR
jgi:predicted RNase H-like HicB family nuclease